MTGRFLTADGPEGPLFAYIAAGRFTESAVATRRFAASLCPFQHEERARLALIMAGGENVREAT